MRRTLRLTKVLVEAVKITSFVQFWALNAHILNILGDKVRGTHPTLRLHAEVRTCSVCLEGEHYAIVWVASWTSQFFSMEHHVYLKEPLKYKLWLFKLGYLAELFRIINEANLSFQGGKKGQYFLKLYFEFLSKNQIFGKLWVGQFPMTKIFFWWDELRHELMWSFSIVQGNVSTLERPE